MAHFSPRSLAASRSRVRTRRVGEPFPPYSEGTSGCDMVISSRLEAACAVPGSAVIVPPGQSHPPLRMQDLTFVGPGASARPFAVAVGDWQAPVPAKRLDGDLRAGRRLAALVLRGIDHPQHPVDNRGIVAGGDKFVT